jgi:hypothetical protein
MADYQVTCSKKDGADEDRRIDGLGGPVIGYRQIDTIIGWIDAKVHTFWTTANGKAVNIVTRTHPSSGRKYLTTEGDSFPPNNLLALPDCPKT